MRNSASYLTHPNQVGFLLSIVLDEPKKIPYLILMNSAAIETRITSLSHGMVAEEMSAFGWELRKLQLSADSVSGPIYGAYAQLADALAYGTDAEVESAEDEVEAALGR